MTATAQLQQLETRHSVNTESYILSRFIVEPAKGEITVLLERLSGGDSAAEDILLPRVYSELHRMALSRMNGERPGHTLQATALVHEAYLRLCRRNEIGYKDRGHFFRLAGRVMRRILVDYARQRNTGKRNSGQAKTSLDEAIALSKDQSFAAIEMDQVLDRLAGISPRQAQVVEMRFFAGLSEEQIAEALGKSVRTIKRDWLMRGRGFINSFSQDNGSGTEHDDWPQQRHMGASGRPLRQNAGQRGAGGSAFRRA